MDTAFRAKALRMVMGYDQQNQFAAFLGMSDARWGNVERGYPLSRQIADKLVQMTGVTYDWLYHDNYAGLPFALANQLREAERKVRERARR